MADSGCSQGGERWESLGQAADKVLVLGVTDHTVVPLYNKWASDGYDRMHVEAASKKEYLALKVFQDAMKDLFPANRDTAVMLDVGAGTGLAGRMMHEIGFKVMDALDPSPGMLRVAEEKQIYRHIYTCFLTGQPSHIPQDSYDCITMIGVMCHGSVKCEAFEEMTRLIKPGGYIVNCLRRDFLTEVPDYQENWEPLKARMVKEGRWKVIKMDPYPKHFLGKEGLLMVIQVLQ